VESEKPVPPFASTLLSGCIADNFHSASERKMKHLNLLIGLCTALSLMVTLSGFGSRCAWAYQEVPALASAIPVGKTVVVAEKGGDYKTVQEALNAAPTDKNTRFVIRIKPGIYREKLTVGRDKGPISLLSEDARTTVLTWNDNAKTLAADGKEVGTSGSASVTIFPNDFVAENLSFENTFGQGSQAVAVNVWSDRAIFRKCRFEGWQDTLLINRNRQYFEDCYISGHVDFIFGASAAWFERCELFVRLGGSITAASTPAEQPFGMVFSNCKITAAPLAERQAARRLDTTLGRTWRPHASVILLNTEISDVVRPSGWDNWGNPDNEKTARYAEYKSSGPGANPTARVPWSKQLSDADAAAITPEKVLGGWNPKAAGA
jgi:pectinesterase